MKIGMCTCTKGIDGSPCTHQLVVAINFRKVSLNCIPTLHPSCHRQLAYIAVGNKANSDLSFYASVSQCIDEVDQPDMMNTDVQPSHDSFIAVDSDSSPDKSIDDHEDNTVQLSQELDSVFGDIKMHLTHQDPHFLAGIRKFIDRYNKMRKSNHTALMTSAFHCFGSSHFGTVTSARGGKIRRGRRIPVQATASGRRKYGSKGKAPASAGRPPSNKQKENAAPATSRYKLPLRKEAKGKRPHNLALSVLKGTQNAGKW